MNKLLISITVAATCLAPIAVVAQVAAAPAAHGARAGKQLQGRVSAVDLTKNTVTVTNRKNPTGDTVTLAPNAKIFTVQASTLGAIAVGNRIEAIGAATPGATTIAATRLSELPPAKPNRKAKANAGYRKNSIEGIVATTTPALTITTPGGVTVTVNTTAVTQVTKNVAGTASDITVGKTVQMRTTGEAPNLTAQEVHVLPAREGRKGKKGHRHPKPAV